MATASKEPKFSELVARITTLYNHASKAGDKVIVDALKASASHAGEELLTLFDQFPVAPEASPAIPDRGSDRTLVPANIEFPKSNYLTGPSHLDRLVVAHDASSATPDRGSDRKTTLVATEVKPKSSLSMDTNHRVEQSLEEMIQDAAHVEEDPLMIKDICRHCKQERRAGGSCLCPRTGTDRSTQKPVIKQEPIRRSFDLRQYVETVPRYPDRGYKRSRDSYYPEDRYSYDGTGDRRGKRGQYY